MFDNFSKKTSLVVVYTGDGKGKTSAGLGLLVRSLGGDHKTAFVQFVKSWEVSEHIFLRSVASVYGEKLTFYKGGKGFYKAGELSARATDTEHAEEARRTFDYVYGLAISGDYKLVICDEINNAVADGLLKIDDLKKIINNRHPDTSLCLTGRNFPKELIDSADIVTEMTKIKHHYDDGFLANEGIDY